MEGFIGEIRAFAGTYAPQGWHFCDGSMLPINSYKELYALIGTTYGYQTANDFKLPDLRGQIPIGIGQGPGLSSFVIGNNGGFENVTLTTDQIPNHTHLVSVSTSDNTITTPSTKAFLSKMYSPGGSVVGYTPGTITTPVAVMDSSTIAQSGGSQQHSNLMPCTPVSFIICTNNNIYPPTP
ncbi:hypothetical protein SDC9_160773 [bioreactor metagenome]|uniref:Phage tail collar domain-containing protein n=1 Tax=bioreactor metagenome TaxID=1076179 RepID=A0A645FIU7_9ZZZZ|nr:tail fiber protein [Rikenellaceae bacterium]